MGNSTTRFSNAKFGPSRQVDTHYGSMVGKRLINTGDKQVDAFLGIPYAKPPIGDLRFMKAVPPDQWSGIRRMDKFGPRSVQNDVFFLIKWKYGPVSEDCLYLNVFTPVWEPPSDGFPVMVFVHGGAYVCDSAVKYGDIGICKSLVTKGVVVVTIQYRLGYLGFFSTGDDACIDNLALWDMTTALQWVQDNISFFNGNKNNVTLFGQSAGGACVDLMTLSPHSRDLFHKVIPMAGTAACDWAINDDIVQRCRVRAAEIGVQSTNSFEFISRLKKANAMQFATAIKFSANNYQSTEIGPRLDGHFIPKSPSELRCEAPQKPTLVGTCRSEGLLYSLFDRNLSSFCRLEHLIARTIPESKYPNFKQLRDSAIRLYIDPENDMSDKQKVAIAIVNFYSDVILNTGTLKLVKENAHLGHSKTYFYSFDYFNPKSWGFLGYKMPFKDATHCTELAYLFHVGIVMDFKFTADDEKMLDIMTNMWTNFAKYGDPNGSPDDEQSKLPFQWLPVNKENVERHLSINLSPKMSDEFQGGRPRFWLNLLSKEKEDLIQVEND